MIANEKANNIGRQILGIPVIGGTPSHPAPRYISTPTFRTPSGFLYFAHDAAAPMKLG